MVRYYVREGKNPKTGAAQFYGQNDKVDVIDMNTIADEVSHATTVTKADVRGVLTEMEYILVRLLRNNRGVRFGILGSFSPTVKSTAARLPEEFTKANLKRIAVRFTPAASIKFSLRAENPAMVFERIVEEE